MGEAHAFWLVLARSDSLCYHYVMHLRRATVADLPSIREIYNQAVRERSATCDEEERSLEEREKWFQQFDEQHPIFVLEVENSITAYGALHRYNPRSGYRFTAENSVYVHNEHRGKGYGEFLLRHLIATAKDRGFHYLEAKIFEHNPASLRLHEKLGFRTVGVQREIANLDGEWKNNVLLALHLNQSQQPASRTHSGSPWEEKVSYCRAIRRGNSISVSGTTSMKDGKVHAPGDPYAQALRCFEIIEEALRKLGAAREDIVRTRMYVTDIKQWEEIGKAHGDFFRSSSPAATMVEVKALIDPELLIEVEAEAIV